VLLVITICHASGRLRDHLEFIRGSMLEVPVDGEKKFDLITCFEGIEHISEHERFLSEVKRLLKDDGLFIGSTPNKLVYRDEPGSSNPFHQKELYFDELRTLLK
jgi:2-polyprenyl-3-methyl-5-hydroxy-6-metoxy-1,4-benzoquinol methylase